MQLKDEKGWEETVKIISQVGGYGEQLKKWHNTHDTQYGQPDAIFIINEKEEE